MTSTAAGSPTATNSPSPDVDRGCAGRDDDVDNVDDRVKRDRIGLRRGHRQEEVVPGAFAPGCQGEIVPNPPSGAG